MVQTIDVYLDSGLIPSLSGGSAGGVDHHALMGRPILPRATPMVNIAAKKKGTKPLAIPPGRSDSSAKARGGPVGRSMEMSDEEITPRAKRPSEGRGEDMDKGGGLKGLMRIRPPVHRRTSSLDGRTGAPTVGDIVGQKLGGSKLHREASTKQPSQPRLLGIFPSATSAPQPGQILSLPQTPKYTQKSSPPIRSSHHLSPPPQTARHARSSSWAAPPTARNSCIPLFPSSPSPPSRRTQDPIELLTKLHHLVPPSRLDPLAPPPSSSTLHPPTLLAGLAFILEALVSERQILSSSSTSHPASPLPLLRNRTAIQSKSRDLDWAATHAYLLSFGRVLEGLMGMIMATEVCEATLGLVEMIKTHVDKMRKVFGEVAGMYMEGYSFVSGWWDEAGMRGSAKEVGRWGELVGVASKP
ncbi:uncharacterized protein MKK02DRAFT_28570 [Dioszegia hungarica]|uniref:Uncharacterized protein n=1 Tax=Dioszegia hungarica TaxID=4972 RepID=A0AA38H7Q1_9TREE|nr:uncharacterized protein MKK02DRAFT_28570 [Dioszegia hungarica]KAI9633804.1 hypothetical protein MKK02DRAFT_28570 [Dioszegia hungarica]